MRMPHIVVNVIVNFEWSTVDFAFLFARMRSIFRMNRRHFSFLRYADERSTTSICTYFSLYWRTMYSDHDSTHHMKRKQCIVNLDVFICCVFSLAKVHTSWQLASRVFRGRKRRVYRTTVAVGHDPDPDGGVRGRGRSCVSRSQEKEQISKALNQHTNSFIATLFSSSLEGFLARGQETSCLFFVQIVTCARTELRTLEVNFLSTHTHSQLINGGQFPKLIRSSYDKSECNTASVYIQNRQLGHNEKRIKMNLQFMRFLQHHFPYNTPEPGIVMGNMCVWIHCVDFVNYKSNIIQ